MSKGKSTRQAAGCQKKQVRNWAKTHMKRPWPRGWEELGNVWHSMLQRCYYKNGIGYARYGGRGITVCDEWRLSRHIFYKWAITHGWDHGLQIDRINNDGNYEPSNCRFVTASQNCRNHSKNLFITAFGETKVVADWENDPRCVVNRVSIRERMKKGWGAEEAISTPRKDHDGGMKVHRALGMDVYNLVVKLILDGLNNSEIERRLGVSNVFAGLVRYGRTWHSGKNGVVIRPLPKPQPKRQKELI